MNYDIDKESNHITSEEWVDTSSSRFWNQERMEV
jgi:hypothetical protein